MAVTSEGCVPPASVAVRREGGVCLGVGWLGVCPGGGTPLSNAGIDTLPVNRMTDRCKNIAFPQLRLRAVINIESNLPIEEFATSLV